MEGLSIEEKAKAYDEALKQIKECTPDENGFITIYPQEIFPELAENKDERIRKALIKLVKKAGEGYENVIDGVSIEDAISWLEKQGEQKPVKASYTTIVETGNGSVNAVVKRELSTDECYGEQRPIGKVEPKFKVGDIIRLKGTVAEYTINKVTDTAYYTNGWSCSIEKCENDYERVEPKYAEIVRTNFKDGDWVVDNNIKTPFQITGISNENYDVISIYGNDMAFSFREVEHFYHLWTIQDAKDGDVLAVENIIFIYERTLASHIVSYCKLINDVFEPFEDARTCCEGNPYVHPSTKEQRDLLFKKMHEAGYEWDAEKKELKKIEQKPEENSIISLKDFQEAFELKAKQYEIELPNREYDIYAMCKELYSLLIKQKPTWIWSEEDEEMIIKICQDLYDYPRIKSPFDDESFNEASKKVQFIKSLKDRVQLQPWQKWTKEDKERYISCLQRLSTGNPEQPETINSKWFKEHVYSKPQWKPDSSMLICLEYAIKHINKDGDKRILSKLLEQLKQL